MQYVTSEMLLVSCTAATIIQALENNECQRKREGGGGEKRAHNTRRQCFYSDTVQSYYYVQQFCIDTHYVLNVQVSRKHLLKIFELIVAVPILVNRRRLELD